jgi:beta-glucosidase
MKASQKIVSFLFVLLCISGLLFPVHSQQSKNLPQLGKSPVKDVIAAMSLEEKVSVIVGTNKKISNSPIVGNSEGRIKGAAGYTMGIERLGIPGTAMADGPAGVRIDPIRKDDPKTYYATGWPVGTLLASSWDTTLVKKVGIAFGNEVKEYGIDVILAPGLNIHRDPLCGRNFEYYSEDPLVTGYMAAAIVNGIQSNGVGTSIKHFAVNNQESNREHVNANVSERALREIYLKGFEIAVKKSQPWTVMSSYNKLNGTYTSQRSDLLTQILRNEWGFKGYVMTDWFGGDDRVAQINAGNDLIMPGGSTFKLKIIDAVNDGTLDVKVLDKNVERILNVVKKSPSFANYKYSNTPDLKAHAVLSREAASESMVLLKNDGNTLPLKKNTKIAVFGVASYNTYVGGTGSGEVNKAYTVSFAEGLKNAGYLLNVDLQQKYKTHLETDRVANPPKKFITLGAPRMTPELDFASDIVEKSASESDVAIFTIGRNAGEGADRPVTDNFNLTNTEKSLIKNISDVFHAKGKKMIVLINVGGVIETASWKDMSDAILLAWQPGQEAGNALADVLSGIVNPSGKLATTFPIKYDDLPSAKNFPGTPIEKPTEVVYEEGIYVGYRYFNSFGVKTSFPFGFGLSYTTFSYSNFKLSSSTFNKPIKATVAITNTGNVAGKEVVQLYLSAPTKSMDKPAEELKGFAKTRLLNPGESQTITFILYPKDLASFNTSQSAWIADAGNYKVKIGSFSEEIKLTKSFMLTKELIVEKVNKTVTPQIQINELKNGRISL